MQIFNLIKEKEISLHQHDVRSDIVQLKKLLHPEFIEIGYSGTVYDFDTIVEDLFKETKPQHSVIADDFEFRELSPSVILLMYKSARKEMDGQITRHAMRSSVWVQEAGEWFMRFHQGTPAEELA